MLSETHERARFLLDQAMVEGISPDEQRWLDHHLEACSECGRYAELCRRAVRALGSFSFEVDPAAATRVQDAVRDRVALSGGYGRRVSASLAVACFLTVTGSMAMWLLAGWLAARWDLPAGTWQIAFAVFWVLPSVVLDVLLFLRGEGEMV